MDREKNFDDDLNAAFATLSRNAVDIIPGEELFARLSGAEPLRIKFGLDPTAPDIHLGHAVALQKLREFQDLGHTAVMLVGDYTALVGDPSGRSKTRPMLTPEEIAANTRTYLDQAYLLLDPEKTEVRHNSEWLSKLGMAEIIELTRSTTVARILERDDFSQRFRAGDSISLTELLYPMMQAYDSVAMDADVELGGTDQLYNLLMGRHVMEYYGKRPQCVMTVPLLVGTDGVKKMSKSLGNYIGVSDDAREVFGKAMSIPDETMADYYSLLLNTEAPEAPPRDQKRELARRLVARFCGEASVPDAERHFDSVTGGGLPDDIPELRLHEDSVWIVDLISQAGFAKTNGEARRFIRGGAVKIGGERLDDENATLATAELSGQVLQVGKRRYARLVTS